MRFCGRRYSIDSSPQDDRFPAKRMMRGANSYTEDESSESFEHASGSNNGAGPRARAYVLEGYASSVPSRGKSAFVFSFCDLWYGSTAQAAGLKGKISRMVNGDRINITKNKCVLHVALRAPKDAVINGDGKMWSQMFGKFWTRSRNSLRGCSVVPG
ncbi:hypothetical protein RHSIM_Rhsim08G0102600 [Rhododendron simsii]|uniref:Uncharacterized protein n=1 Tax=Rhododendron simsii TaxID=118357 RepID=A0A834LFG9_RHOSS|nr:hypothetical protein RHSIM_Rhsim08G0102600 [Rhododendron simsii]